MGGKLQFFVAGLGRFGQSVAITLSRMGFDVMAMDIDENVVQSLSGTLDYVVAADAADEKNLKAIGAGDADVAVVCIGDLGMNLMTALLLKEMNVKKVVAKARNDLHGKMLSKIGVDRVIYSEKEMGVRVAHNLIFPGIVDYIEMDHDITILSIHVPEDWIGKDMRSLEVRQKYNITVVAIKRESEVIVNPQPDLTIKQDDLVIVLGKAEDIRNCGEECAQRLDRKNPVSYKSTSV